MNVILRNYLTTAGMCLCRFFSSFVTEVNCGGFFFVNKLSQNFKVLTAPILTADSYFMNLKLWYLDNKNPLS